MKPATHIALAVLTLAAAGASAQEGVTVYGVADAGVVNERGCVAPACGTGTKVSSGIASESFVGIRGAERVGGNVDAVFGLEAGVRLDTGKSQQEGKLFNRQAYVGLRWPTTSLTLGRQYTLDYLTLADVADPFHGGMAGAATNLMSYSGKRMDNSIRVENLSDGGVFTAATYGFGERSGDWRANRNWGISLGFTRGALTIRAAHQNRNVTDTTMIMPVGNSYDSRNSIIAANLNLGKATAYAAFGINKGSGNLTLWNPDNPYSASVSSTPSTDSRDILVGLAIPHGATTFLASYIRKNDRDPANRDADQIAIGASYAVSRRTDFYAAISRISNKNGAGYTVGNASEPGSGTKAVNIGMRHAF
ncbi:porin [Massilia arenosa]|uniref:Porin n=1 Tax=Zemynaea arenosa TaxID=2561931 RepID=A0A4Y9SKV2_9BURK|nr:porin [Massilia arenosa]TFW24039.1 porin [Massilia arenosa]